ncbi:alpha/beta fold hydrolase [Undibacterium sp. LX15W]|uniref:Alpha/beta fold hydrolase n=2 Tax=Undibacterium flavidum TaxID=2762297 RepID=A0ABR6Y8R7_9BURK|nr:alpha/beta fold hydrolase [Undibacterium flavidum]
MPVHAEFIQSTITVGEGVNTLYGSVLIPGHKTKPPVVLIIAGSGPTDRDGNSPALPGKNNSLQMLAEELAIAGFASVRYDKRGVGESFAAGGAEENLRFQTYVGDVQAWIKQLSSDPRFGGVAVIGHSEGSTLGLLAVLDSPVLAYVSIAGPAQSAAKILRAQLASKLPADLAKINESILSSMEKSEFVKDVPAPLLALYRPSVQNYLMSWFQVVPADAIKKLAMPVAIFQGDTDIQVGVSQAVLLAQAQPKAELHVVKGMNHIMKSVPADNAQQVASYSDPNLVLDADFLKKLVAFLKKACATKNA